MYKRLLASTALVAAGMVGASAVQAQTAPAAQPLQVTVGGYFEQTFGHASNKDGVTASLRTAADPSAAAAATTIANPTKWGQFNDSEIWFNVKGTLANGITVGARVELEANTEADTIDESFLFVEGAFGRIDMGTTDAASYKTHVSTPGIGKAYGVEQSSANDWIYAPSLVSTSSGSRTSTLTSADHNKISYYTPRFEGLQVGATYTPSATEDLDLIGNQNATRTGLWAVGANFTRAFGGVNVEASLGWEHADAIDGNASTTAAGSDIDEYTAGLRVGFAGFSVGGGYKSTDSGANTNDGEIWSIGLSYTFGPATVGIQYLSDKVQGATTAGDDKHKIALIGGNYTLGPGVDVFANVFHNKWQEESSTAQADNNKGAGAVAGLRLTF